MTYGSTLGPANTTATALYPLNMPSSQTLHATSRMVRYIAYWNYYTGEQWESPPAPGDRRLVFNLCRLTINKVASYLCGSAVGYNAVPAGNTKDDDAARHVEQYLGAAGEEGAWPRIDLETAISAGTLGDGCWRVTWDPAIGYPRVVPIVASAIDARWRQDDLESLLWVKQTYWLCYAELSPRQRRAYGPFHGDIYQPMQAAEEWTPAAWQLSVAGKVVDRGRNPYGVIPYVIFPNLRVPGEFWGESDLCDLLRVQRELNDKLSAFARVLDVLGAPVTAIFGATEEETSKLKLGPGQLWNLPEGVRAEVLKLLEAGGAAAHFQYFDAVLRMFHFISELPPLTFGDKQAASPRSGVALEIELQPLLHKLARRRLMLDSALTRRAQLVLAVARFHGVELIPVRLNIEWPPVLPQDLAALVESESVLIETGVHSVQTAMDRLGVDDPTSEWRDVLGEQRDRLAVGLPGYPHPMNSGVPRADTLAGTGG